MPTYSRHFRFVMGGTVQADDDPADIWSCTINLIQDPADTTTFEPLTYLQDIKSDLGAWFASPDSHIAQYATLDFIKCNQIGTDGKYESVDTSYRLDYNPAPHGTNTPTGPAILSIATSWTSEIMRGPGARGRIYLPNCTKGSVGSMTLDATDRANIVNGGKALLTVLNAGGGVSPQIASGVDGTLATITGVRVGSVKDVQQRRKNAYPETYSVAPWPV